jgi:hypothetical protein
MTDKDIKELLAESIRERMILWGSDDIFETLTAPEKKMADLFAGLHPNGECQTCPLLIDHLESGDHCPECGAQATAMRWFPSEGEQRIQPRWEAVDALAMKYRHRRKIVSRSTEIEDYERAKEDVKYLEALGLRIVRADTTSEQQ